MPRLRVRRRRRALTGRAVGIWRTRTHAVSARTWPAHDRPGTDGASSPSSASAARRRRARRAVDEDRRQSGTGDSRSVLGGVLRNVLRLLTQDTKVQCPLCSARCGGREVEHPVPLTPWKASLHVPGLGLREHSKPLLGARRKRVRRHGGRGVRRHKSDIPSYLRSWVHRGALFSAAPRSPGPAGVHRDFTPQRTAAAERAALGARELVPTAEGLLSGASRTSGGASHSVPGPDPVANRA